MGMKRKKSDGAEVVTPASNSVMFLHGTPVRSVLPSATATIQSKHYLQRQTTHGKVAIKDNSSQALQSLLSNHIQFQPATDLTTSDEKKMAPILRPGKVLLLGGKISTNRDHKVNTDTIAGIPRIWERQAMSLPSSTPLRNHGNRCYRNAVLQALLHIPKVVNWMEIEHKDCTIHDCTLCWFKGLCTEYWNHPSSPRAVNDELVSLEKNLSRTDAFKNLGWEFGEQHDAGDFAVALMNAIIETNPRTTKLLNAMLGHIPVSTKICSVCNLKTTTPKPAEQQRMLLVGWESPMALEHILRKQTFSDCIFQLECEHCRRTRAVLRRERLWTTPDVLIIQLQRFGMGLGRRMRKKMDAIAYPVELDLTEFSETNTQAHYSLQAVVHHRGSLDEGHYIAVAKGPRGRWELINDMERPQMRNVSVKAALDPDHRYTPYLLFYVKLEGRGAHTEKPCMYTSQGARGAHEMAGRPGNGMPKSPTQATKLQREAYDQRRKRTKKK